MNRVRLLTPWGTKTLGRGKTSNFPQVLIDHPLGSGETYQDVTGQPNSNIKPAPTVYTVELVCSDATLAALQADPSYAPGILWSEPT
jgi:hypothetical protein